MCDCYLLFFVLFCSFIWRFTIRSCAIDRWKGARIYWTGISKSSHTRRFGTVSIERAINGSKTFCELNLNNFLFFFRNHGWSDEEVLQIMLSLQSRGIIKAMEFNSFTRTHHEDTEIKVRWVIEIHTSEFDRYENWLHNPIRFFCCMHQGGQANANDCIKSTANNCHYYRTILWKIGRRRDARK